MIYDTFFIRFLLALINTFFILVIVPIIILFTGFFLIFVFSVICRIFSGPLL